jgi:serine protease Do
MNAKRSLAYGAALMLIGLAFGLALSSHFDWHVKAFTQETKISKESIDVLSRTGQAMAEVAAAVRPAVVNISSTKTVRTPGVQSPFFDDPLFRRFFGDHFGRFGHPREFKQSGLGSGVIVDKDGYILTNNHVIDDAEEIKVRLPDKREFKGKVIGADPKTDLAVIKIDSNHLPVIPLGDSENLKVGETVIAVGNPFGLNQTVTSGIVSATGRANVGIADYEDFIQTDAAINPGNSGGALVNVRGELVGVNTAIFSTSGGYQGIGFAIPSAMARVVMDSLIKKGKVVRGWLGVSIQPVTADLAKQFGIREEKGVLVSDVVEESPADKAGIQRGDVIIEYDGREVNDPGVLRNSVAATTPGTQVMLTILRDGKSQKVKVAIAELPADKQKLRGQHENVLKGVIVQGLTPELRKTLTIPKRIAGVVVTEIEEGSPAEGRLMPNDVILEVNRTRVTGMKDYEASVSQLKSGQGVLLLVFRNGSTSYLTLPSR